MPRRELRYDVVTDTSKFSRGLKDSQRELGRLGSQGEKTWGQLKRGAGLAAVGLAGGLVVGLKKSADAAIEAEKTQARLQAQLRASNISFRQHATEITNVIAKHSQLSGLDDEDLTDAFTNIVRVTGDVDKSLRLTGLAADFARAKHIEVAKAGEIVGKVAGGNIGILARYGIQVDKNATSEEALAQLQQKFAGQAEAYGDTTAGSIDRMHVAAENLAETVGQALAPTLADVADSVSKFVTEMQTGEGAGGRFADALKNIYEKVRPIGKFLADHPKLIGAAVAAWGTYKAATLLALGAIKLSHFLDMFKFGKKAAATSGATAGAAYSASFTATSAAAGAGPVAAAGKRSGWLGKAAILAARAAGPLAAAAFVTSFVIANRKKINEVADDVQEQFNKLLPKPFRPDVNRKGDGLGDFIENVYRPKVDKQLPKPSSNEGKGVTGKASVVARRRVPVATAAGIQELFYDPLGGAQQIGGHSDHVHVAAGSTSERDYLMGVATRQFGLTITSTTGGRHVPNSFHYRGLAFDAAGARMADFARWVRDVYNGGGGSSGSVASSGRRTTVRARRPKVPVGSVRGGSGGLGGVGSGRLPALDDPEQFDAMLDAAEAKAGTDEAALARVVQQRMSAAQLRLSKVEGALKGRLSDKTRTRLLKEQAELIKRLADLGGQFQELTTSQGPDLAAQALDADLIAAQLSGNKEWERSILQYRADIARQRYDQALTTPDRADDIETGQALQQALDALKAIQEASVDQTALLQQQLDLERQRADRAERNAAVIGANSSTILQAFTELVNGKLGVNLGLGGSMLASAPGKVGSL